VRPGHNLGRHHRGPSKWVRECSSESLGGVPAYELAASVRNPEAGRISSSLRHVKLSVLSEHFKHLKCMPDFSIDGSKD